MFPQNDAAGDTRRSGANLTISSVWNKFLIARAWPIADFQQGVATLFQKPGQKSRQRPVSRQPIGAAIQSRAGSNCDTSGASDSISADGI